MIRFNHVLPTVAAVGAAALLRPAPHPRGPTKETA